MEFIRARKNLTEKCGRKLLLTIFKKKKPFDVIKWCESGLHLTLATYLGKYRVPAFPSVPLDQLSDQPCSKRVNAVFRCVEQTLLNLIISFEYQGRCICSVLATGLLFLSR